MVTMLTSRKPGTEDKKLLLGDYITVHVPGSKVSGAKGGTLQEMRVSRESFVQRSQKQRGELFQRTRRQTGTLIDVRQRGVA